MHWQSPWQKDMKIWKYFMKILKAHKKTSAGEGETETPRMYQESSCTRHEKKTFSIIAFKQIVFKPCCLGVWRKYIPVIKSGHWEQCLSWMSVQYESYQWPILLGAGSDDWLCFFQFSHPIGDTQNVKQRLFHMEPLCYSRFRNRAVCFHPIVQFWQPHLFNFCSVVNIRLKQQSFHCVKLLQITVCMYSMWRICLLNGREILLHFTF